MLLSIPKKSNLFTYYLRMLSLVVIALIGLGQLNKSMAQVFPVNVNTTLRAPYTLNLSDYASPTYDRIQASIYLADLTKVNYPVKLRLVIRSSGGINISTVPGQELGPVFLNGGQTVILTGVELSRLFDPNKLQFSGITQQQYQKNAALPEGIYQFQIEVLDYNFGVAVSNVNSGFATAWLILNDPPIINKPENNATIVPKNPQNIFFQWTPRHTGSPNIAKLVEYDIQMVEIIPSGRNANDAMLTSPPIFEKTVFSTSYNYTVMDPYLFPGKWYAFRVRVREQNGLDLFKNQGYSEVFQFYYGEDCPLPKDIKIDRIDDRSVIVYWESSALYLSADIQYKGTSDKNWKTVNSGKNTATITDLTPGEEYKFRLVGYCTNNVSEPTEEMLYKMTGGVASACSAPTNYKVEKTGMDGKDTKAKITWNESEGVKKYNVYIECGSYSKKYSLASSDYLQESNPKSYVKEITIPADTFRITFEAECSNGGVSKGLKELIDLRNGTVNHYTCEAPLDEQVSVEIEPKGNVSVVWKASNNFDSYKFTYRNIDEKEQLVRTTTASRVILEELKEDEIYEYKILYHCLNGTWVEGKPNTFKVTYSNPVGASTGACFPPSNIKSQVNEDISATIAWPKDKEVKGYRIYYREKANTTGVWDSLEVKDEDAVIKNLKKDTEYEYKISALCKSGNISMPSLVLTFNTSDIYTYKGTCEIPVLKKPTVNSLSEATVEWEPKTYYSGYLLQYKKADGTSAWMEINSKLPSYQLGNLEEYTKYEYNVAALCGIKQSDFTAIDTFRTNLVPPAEFICGQDKMVNIKSRTPISSLKKGDKFTAADFELTITELTSEKPYKGKAYATIPYLKHSRFLFGFDKVMVNEYGQMYEGQAYLIGADIQLIDPKIAGSINNLLDKVDKGLDAASNYLALADSIQSALNDIIQTANQPIDWSKYEGWSAEKLLAEGKRLMTEGQKLISSGKPQSIAQAKQMVMEGIELVKAAVAMGKQIVSIVSSEIENIFKKIFVSKKDSLNKEQEKISSSNQLLKEIDKYNGFTIDSSDVDLSNESIIIIDSVDVSMQDLSGDSDMNVVIQTYKKEKSDWLKFIYLGNIINNLEAILNDKNKLNQFIQTIVTDFPALNLKSADIFKTDSKIEEKIKVIITNKLKDF